MKLNGSSNQKICEISGPMVYINDNFIYFKETDVLTRQSNDSAALKRSFIGSIGPLYRMRIDATERQLIIPDKTLGIYEADKHFYYLSDTTMAGREIYRTDLNGENVTKLPLKGDFAGIIDNYIYYVEYNDNKIEMYRTSLDFKKTQKIENEISNQT